jgi:hypothetical protein
MNSVYSFIKTSTEVLDYQINWSDWLDGDTISTASWTVSAGLTEGTNSNTTTTSTVWLSGGVDGHSYLATNTIVTASSRTGVRSLNIFVRDAIRLGMLGLVQELRGLCNIGTADYSVNGMDYYTDYQLQSVLDRHVKSLDYVQLRSVTEYNSGGTAVYHDFYAPLGNLEASVSGSAYWQVHDQNNVPVGTANYTPDYNRGHIRFTADTAGSAYYLRGRSYDLNRAAAEIWKQQASFVAMKYDIRMDDQAMNRSQMHKHCLAMAAEFQKQAGARTVRMVRGDL